MYLFDHKASVFISLTIVSPTWAVALSIFLIFKNCTVSILLSSCACSVFPVWTHADTHGKLEPRYPEDHWKDSQHQFHEQLQHWPTLKCLLRDLSPWGFLLSIISSFHLTYMSWRWHFWIYSLCLRTGKSTTSTVSVLWFLTVPDTSSQVS